MRSALPSRPGRLSMSSALVVATMILPTAAIDAAARHPATIARQGSFEAITNVNSRDINGNKTNDNTIERFVMSADGSTAVYSMIQNPLSGCANAAQIRRVDIATGQDDRIGGCTENLRYQYNSFDVSDDGSRIVYIRENVAENPEIVRCDFAAGSCAKSVVLQMIANGPATSLWISPHSADNEQGSLVLSGDGSKIFFRNYFTMGSPGRYSGPITFYRVDAVSGSAVVLFKFTDLASYSPPLRSNTTFVPSLHAVDFTGSTMVFDSRASSPTVGWHDVAVIDVATGLASVKSIAQNAADSCCSISSPDISSDGRTVTYVQRPGGAPNPTGGVHVQQIDGDLAPVGSAVVIDSSSATKFPSYPCLSGDGTTVGMFDDMTSRFDFRMAPSAGGSLVNITRPAVEVDRRGNTCAIPSDGSSLLLYGSVRTSSATTSLPWELLRFRWQTSPVTPAVTAVTADPTEWFARDSNTLHPSMFTTFFWETAFVPMGEQLGRAYTAFLSPEAERSDRLNGEDAFGGFLDGDADGTYSDDFFSVEGGYVDAWATLRFGVTASNGTATVADVDVVILDEAIESNQGSSFGTSPKSVGTVTFTFDDNECCGEITVQRFDYAPPNSIGALAEFWRIFSGSPQGFYGGNGITTQPYSATLTFVYSQVTDPGAVSLYRTLDGLDWELIPSTVNAAANEITTAAGQSDVDGLWAIGEGTPVLSSVVFTDGFESGDLAAWSL